MAAQAPMTDNKSIISLRQVNFSYPTRSSVRVLDGVDLDICQGSLIALVGPSGSGKSTIAALLMGLHSLPDHGEYSASSIRLYGQDIRNIPLSILRAICAFVPQHPTICPSTVWENICYGLDPHTCLTSASNVQWAAKMTAIDDFVESLPFVTILSSEKAGSVSQEVRLRESHSLERWYGVRKFLFSTKQHRLSMRRLLHRSVAICARRWRTAMLIDEVVI
jgi:ABC-type multidrug transport system fused ATPase/permease subunit